MKLLSVEEYDRLAAAELSAAAELTDLTAKKRRLNQAAELATLAELTRHYRDNSRDDGSPQ